MRIRSKNLSGLALLMTACSTVVPNPDADLPAVEVRAGHEYGCAKVGAGEHSPWIERVSPGEGQRFGQTRLTVEGHGFQQPVEVRVGEARCEKVLVESNSRITCIFTPIRAMTRPSAANQSYDVRVIQPNGRCGVSYQAFGLVSQVEIDPRAAAAGPGNTIRFQGRRGIEPFRFNLTDGSGKIDERTGVYEAGKLAGKAVVRVTDAAGTIDEALVEISSPLSLVPGRQELAIPDRVWLTASGGVPPYVYSQLNGPGRLDAKTGQYFAEGGAGEAKLEVSDSLGNRVSTEIKVRSALSLKLNMSEIAVGNRVELQARGGIPPYVFSVPSGRGQLILDGDHQASFIASQEAGTILLRVEDARKAVQDETIHVAPSLMARASEKQVMVGDRVPLRVMGGVPPYNFELDRGQGRIDSVTGTFFAPKNPGKSSIVVTDRLGNSMAVSLAVTEGGIVSRKISAGYAHTCAVFGESAKCWGEGRHGQLGNGDTARQLRPVSVRGLEKGVVSISAGFYHTCALLVGGAVKCWGDNRYGQLGNGSTGPSSTPVSVAGLTAGVKSISSGQFHVCAVKNNGVLCWGDNRRGQLGDGTRASSALPVRPVELPNSIEYVGAGSFHTCAASKEKAWCWGYNRAGQLGNGEHKETNSPIAVRELSGEILALDAKGSHSCAVTSGSSGTSGSTNTLYCWGYNGPGQIGDSTTEFRYVPKWVSRITRPISSIALGYTHTCAVEDEGQAIRCWGNNVNGQLGSESQIQYQPVPVPVNGVPVGIDSVATGVDHTCALLSDSVWCWGMNRAGSFGNGSQQSSRTPVRAFWTSDYL